MGPAIYSHPLVRQKTHPVETCRRRKQVTGVPFTRGNGQPGRFCLNLHTHIRHNRRPHIRILDRSRVLQKITHSRQLSPSVPPASQGAIQKESRSTSLDTTQCKCSSRSHTETVARMACFNRFMAGIGSCRLSTRDFPRTECSISSRTGAPSSYPSSGVTPGAARTSWTRLSIKVSQVSSGDTAGQRPDRQHPRRPSPKKLPGTYNRRPAGQTHRQVRHSPLYLTPPRPGGMHLPPPPPAKTTGEYSSDTAGHRTRPRNRRTLCQV